LLNSKEFFGRRTLHHEHLHPWIQPVVTMGDLYHPAIPDRAIDEVMGVVAHADAVAFWNLTKYIERAQQYWADRQPPYNWWQGVSVETPAYLPRIHFLQQPGFTIRIVAFEPLLAHFSDEDLDKYLHLVDWVLIGSEYRFTRYSGEEIRPAPVEWIEDLIRAAKRFRLPVMITQMAGKAKEKYKPLLWGDQRGWPHVRGKDAVVLGRTWRELPDFEFRPYETEHYD
jgi:protein gp37